MDIVLNVDGACDCETCKVSTGTKVEKGWGHELVIANSEKYCGKVMHFHQGARFSMHYHIRKTETWYVASGQFEFRWIDTESADMKTQILNVGDIVTNEIGQPHQLICLREGDVFEVSTQHFDSDSYRVMKGNSQTSDKKHPRIVLLMHMGLGDHILMAPAVREVSKQCEKLYVPCKSIYSNTLRFVYGDVKNLELLPIMSTTDERILGSELQRVIGELGGGQMAIAATGVYNSRPNPVYPFPGGFYKDLGLDFMACRKDFKWNATQSPLVAVLKHLGLEHSFVHDTSSTQKGGRIAEDARRGAKDSIVLLNPDRNMYEPTHPFYYLAQLAVRKPSQDMLESVSLMESARELYLIDSCYFSLTAFMDLSRVGAKHLYKRADVKFEWLTPDLGWNEIVM